MPDDFPHFKERPDRARTFAESPLYKALGLTLDEVRPGFARVRMATSSFTLGGIGGSVHGGLLAALVDIAMLEAQMPILAPGDRAAGTADLNITYLRPALTPFIYADATVVRKGRQLIVTEVNIVDDQGRLCAMGRTIYSLRVGENTR